MSVIYIVTWALSLLSCAGIYYGLIWYQRQQPKEIPIRPESDRRTKLWLSRQRRADRSPFYVTMIWSLFVGSLIMLIGGPVHPSTIDSIDSALVQRLLALVLCLGTGLCILGFISGTRYFRPGADLRDCYRLAIMATPANVSTLLVYAQAVGETCHWNLRLFALGAGGLLAVAIAHMITAWGLYYEIKRLDEFTL